jgi:hypothetical protein
MENVNSFDSQLQKDNSVLLAPPTAEYRSPFADLLALSQTVLGLELEIEEECARVNQTVRKNFLNEVN